MMVAEGRLRKEGLVTTTHAGGRAGKRVRATTWASGRAPSTTLRGTRTGREMTYHEHLIQADEI